MVLGAAIGLFLPITVDDHEDRSCELMLLKPVPEVHDRGVFRDRCVQRQAGELAHVGDFVERVFHGRIG